jgi:quinol monooxygenase YgiN
MTTIAENTDLATFINVFTVEPSNQQALLDLLVDATESHVRRIPGFVSAALHRSVDGTRVTMYAQWQSLAHYQDYQSTLSDPGRAPYVEKVLAIARFEPARQEVVKVFAAAATPSQVERPS